MHLPVEVAVTDDWRTRADAFARETGMLSARSGKLAEFAVADYFRRNGVFVREDPAIGRPDYFDINLGNTLVDVKSCLAPARELRVTKDHFDRGRRFAFYIGVQMSRDRQKARIFGFCSKSDISQAPFRLIGRRMAYYLPFSKLQPVQKLVEAFRRDF